MIKHSNGMYTPNEIQRCSKMAGTFHKEVRNMLQNVTNRHISEYESKPKSPKHNKDVLKFVNEFVGDGLFTYCPPRNHSTFPSFEHEYQIKSPYRLGLLLNWLHNISCIFPAYSLFYLFI